MKRLKRIACLFLTLALMVMCLPMPGTASAATTVISGNLSDTITWKLDSEGTLTIDGTGTLEEDFFYNAEWNENHRNDIKALVVEDGVTSDNFTFDLYKNLESVSLGNGITGIGRCAFELAPALKTVSLGANTKSIGDHAFHRCSLLSSITIPNTVTTIDVNAFWECSSLTNIVIPDSVTSLGRGAFQDCTSLESVVIGNGVVKIDANTFAGCSNLQSVTIGESVESTGLSAFAGCKKLTKLSIPDSLKDVGRGSFSGCTALKEIDFGNGISSIGESAFSGCESLESIILPDSVQYVGEYAFNGCDNVCKIDLGNGVTTIAAQAFNCGQIETVNIPASVTTLDPNAFMGFIDGEATFMGFSVDEANATYASDEKGFLYSKDMSVLVRIPNGYTGTYCTPESVTQIEQDALWYCKNLRGITLTKNVKSVDFSGSEECKRLYAVYVMNRETVFADIYSKPQNLTIYGYTNSTAQTFATENDIPFVALDSNLIIVPDLTDTEYTIDSNNICTVYCSGELDELQHVEMDGNTVAESNYILEEGSTIVKFKAAYLDTLSEGYHTVTLVYTSGSVATTINVVENTCEHTYDNTCDTSCNLCGTTRTVTHSWGAITSNDTQHWYECSVCHEKKDLAGHDGGSATCQSKATCTTCGKQYGNFAQCSYTAEVVATKYLKAAATCNTKAIYYKSCPECGSLGTDTFTAGEFDKTNHKGETEIRGAVTATCGDPGYTGDTYCLDCNTKITTGTATNATGKHSGGTATCKEKAVCTTCGTAYGDLAKCEHTEEIAESKYLKSAATCKEKAVYYKSCKVCGSIGTATFTYGEVDKTNHTGGTEIRDVVTANCSNPGYTGDTYCLGCNTKTATGTATEKNDNHSGGTATCKEKAVCTFCGETYGDFAKHSYTEYKSNNDATCEKDGTKTAKCAYGCGTTDTVADVGSAKGHDFKTYTSDKNATCKADGTKTAKCENCDKTNTVADEGSKADHSYGDDNFCDWCGKDKTNPQTGDTTNLVLLTSVMVISLLMMAALITVMYKAKKVR